MFNAGVVVALKMTAVGGGSFGITYITGPAHRNARGLSARPAPLDICIVHPSSSPFSTTLHVTPLHYPVSMKYDASGCAIIPFHWDASSVPATGSHGGIVTIAFDYVHNATRVLHGSGHLYMLSNVTHIATMSHFRLPSGVASLPATARRALSTAERRARTLAGIVNSLSRPALAALVFTP